MDLQYSFILWTLITHILIQGLKGLQVNHRIVQVHNSYKKKKKRISCQDDNPAVKESLSTTLSNSFYDLLVIQLKGFNFINASNSAMPKTMGQKPGRARCQALKNSFPFPQTHTHTIPRVWPQPEIRDKLYIRLSRSD